MFTRSFAVVAVLLLCAGGANIRADARRASDDAAITHVLNRLSYGPRPGEVERVRALGLQKWIDSQLSPSRIDNGPLDRRRQRLQPDSITKQSGDYSAPARAERRRRSRAAMTIRKRGRRAGAGQYAAQEPQVMRTSKKAKDTRDLQRAPLEEVLVISVNHFNVFAERARRETMSASTSGRDSAARAPNFRDSSRSHGESPARLSISTMASTAKGARGAQGAQGDGGAGGRRRTVEAAIRAGSTRMSSRVSRTAYVGGDGG